jgi:Domain of unknown function (DUF4136)
MRTVTWLTSVCLILLGTIAMAQSVSDDYDRAVKFSKYWTYAWTRGTELPDESNHTRVVRAIDVALAAKGVPRVDAADHPDVLVAYHASLDTNLVQPVQVDTLVIEITDARTHAIVWRGRASSDVRPSDSLETREKKINKAAAKMFRHFPLILR